MLGEWQNRLVLYVEEFRAAERLVRADLAGGAVGAATIARLEQLAAGYAGQVACVEALLTPLAIGDRPAARAAMTAFDVRVPAHQDLHSYYVNLHRDWVWGADENRRSAELVEAMIPEATGRLLVLGAGGCRLAYDLHQGGRYERTVALDINPLLMLTAARLLSGEAVDLYEFPIAPRGPGDHAIRRTLTPPPTPRGGLELVFGDAQNPPFADGGFDVVVTPWLCDILDDAFHATACRVNRLLREGGVWVNFGSVSFTGARPNARLGVEEVWEQVRGAGFALETHQDEEIPYMRSPASRHARLETVALYRARKVRAVEPPAPRPPLPAWLRDPRVPIPVSEHLEATAIASRLQAVALALVNGQRSAADLAAFLVEQKLMGPEAALAAVRGMLLRIHEATPRRAPQG